MPPTNDPGLRRTSRATVCCLAGDLGFGFPPSSLERAIALTPDVIALQGTSADPGPYYLGAGKSFYPLGGVKRDLELLLPRALEARIPVIASAGGAGGRDQIVPVVELIRTIAHERGLKLRLAVVYADIDRAWLRRQVAAGVAIPRLGDWPELSLRLTEEDIDRSERIVAQMGPEPIMRAFESGADFVLTGRSVDMSRFAAIPLLHQCDSGPAMHLGKILECGAMAAEPSTGTDGLIATLEGDSFVVEPLALDRRCTVRSIAGHSFYEREDPFHDDLPGGHIDTSAVTYEQVGERQVRVAGARWTAAPYTIKLEGAERIGFRTICIAGLRDPIMIDQIDTIAANAHAAAVRRFTGTDGDFQLLFRQYGKNAILGPIEFDRRIAHELGVVIDVVAPSQALADEVCGFVRSFLNHDDFPGCRTSAGNVAFPFSPSDIQVGPVYRFRIWHLMPLSDPTAPFEIEIIDVKESQA
jgi:hypothetical protein